MGKTTLTSLCHLILVFVLFSFLLSVKSQIFQGNNSLKVHPIVYYGVVGEQYELIVNQSNEYLFEYGNPTGVSSSSPAHITVECNNARSDHPVMIVLRQAKEVLSWQIPYRVGDSNYTKTSRILCPDANYNLSRILPRENLKYVEDNSFYVSISSGSPDNLIVHMTVTILRNFTVSPNTEYHIPPVNMSFTPSQPWYYQFKWPENMTLHDGNVTASTMKSVVLKVDSDDNICMTMSIQSLECPVLDLERTVGYEGFKQTMDRKGGVTLTKEEYSVGFHIVFVVNGDDRKCHEKYLAKYENARSKELKFQIYETISFDTLIIAVTAPVMFLLSVYALFFIAAIVCFCRPYRESVSTSTSRRNLTEDPPDESAVSEIPEAAVQAIPVYNDFADGTDSDSSVNSQQNTVRPERPAVAQVVRCLADLSRKRPRELRRRSDLYALSLLTVAVFYALPVFQLMYSNQSILQKTGNQDTCFYNFLCAYPQRVTDTIVIGDFNHVFSNIGYIALGLLFILWTSRRDAMHLFAVTRRRDLDEILGIPQHYGLFYALGLALMMEGFLSAMYHVCPNETNFQFDTSFMYVIAVLCMVKLYQNRHPDINARAHTTFLILAVIIFIGMLGIMENSTFFFRIFTGVHITMCGWVSVQVYRMRPLSIGNIANWVLVSLGEVFALKSNFGSYLLTVLLVNLLLYFVFYISMKLICREKLTLEPLAYMVLATILWAFSGVFYLSRVTSWASTPAGSRHNNEVCNFLQFYDNHDIWHFLSAGSMFCTFMILLTLDDGIIEVHRSKILVF